MPYRAGAGAAPAEPRRARRYPGQRRAAAMVSVPLHPLPAHARIPPGLPASGPLPSLLPDPRSPGAGRKPPLPALPPPPPLPPLLRATFGARFFGGKGGHGLRCPQPHARHPSCRRGSGGAAELGHYREGGRDRGTLRERGRRDGEEGASGAPAQHGEPGGVRGQARGGSRSWAARGMEQGMPAPGHPSPRPGPCALPRSEQVHSALLRGVFERVT